MIAYSTPTPTASNQRPIKVMIIDDSAIIRGLVSRWIGDQADFEYVGGGINGRDGLMRAPKFDPDIIILDIEMPEMDGLTALPQLLAAVPGVKVIMASTLTKSGAEVTIKALTLGAADYIPKPDAGRIAGAEEYKQELFTKLRGLGRKKPNGRAAAQPARPVLVGAPVPRQPFADNKPSELRPLNLRTRIEALFIGSSTGGPEALRQVVQGLVGQVKVPIFLTQHMPVLFTKILADHLAKQCNAKVVEAEHNMIPVPDQFHLAPGGKHMVVARTASGVRIHLNDDPPENFCKPAVDPLFRSAAQVYGDHVLAVVLTGMGHDGREGGRKLVERGANIIVQDEASSVVWGMPGSVAAAGLASAIKPINEIAPSILKILRGVAP
ncbi:MAG: two-component system chemotaxis family response regulator CheB [Hyphomonadaceae bacterium]|nr:MAG: two-component system chemotaxis family response regulator CheB [Hyphomonadaceae bacterium]KAF0184991.1 MAG: two-component system chemotaxis family response regulator CheB [Hyphomonadaceae bacterium]